MSANFSHIISKSNLIKIVTVFLFFLFFLSGAIGLIDISLSQIPMLRIHSRLLSQPDYHQLILNKILFSKEFIFLLISGLTLTFIIPLMSPVKASLLTFTVIPVAIYIGYTNTFTPMIPLEYSLLTILVLYMVNILVSYFIELHSRNKLLATFSQYIPPHLVNELIQQPDKLSLEGEAKTLTVFFCDLQHFTSISEELNPKQLNILLNEYFTVMTEILFKFEATIDKYIGDAIMAFWNAPTRQEAHAQRAVEAALEMNQAIQVLARSFIARGWPGLQMGTGINTGRANVGNIGSKYRMAYTAIGDAVNLASRIETLTRTYRVPILISEHTYEQLTGIRCREIDVVRVRGKHQLTRIYQPLCKEDEVDNQLKEKLILHKEALELYHSEKYDNSIRLFKELYDLDTNDKYYKAMIRNIMETKT